MRISPKITTDRRAELSHKPPQFVSRPALAVAVFGFDCEPAPQDGCNAVSGAGDPFSGELWGQGLGD